MSFLLTGVTWNHGMETEHSNNTNECTTKLVLKMLALKQREVNTYIEQMLWHKNVAILVPLYLQMILLAELCLESVGVTRNFCGSTPEQS